MSEKLPEMKLGLDSEEFIATPENAHLFTHMGRLGLSMYDHIFLLRGQDEGTMTGTYLFNRIHLPESVFAAIEEFMIANGYHADLNRDSVPQCDIDAFNSNLAAQMQDIETIPEGWE